MDEKKKHHILKSILLKYGVIIITVLLLITFSIVSEGFLSTRNILNLLSNVSIIGLLALGLTCVIISGEFDISFASNAVLCSIICIRVLEQGAGLVLGWSIPIVIAIFISSITGFIIAYIGMPSFVTTVGMLAFLQGLSYWFSGGALITLPVSAEPEHFEVLGRYLVLGVIPTSVIILIIVGSIFVLFCDFTGIGRKLYAAGSNPEAARRVGIDPRKMKFLAFIITGITAGIAAVIIASRFAGGNPRLEPSFQFPAIIIAFLGAVSLKEGLPNPGGTLTAILLMGVIQNGLVMFGAPIFLRDMVQGAIMLIAVALIAIMKSGNISAVKTNM